MRHSIPSQATRLAAYFAASIALLAACGSAMAGIEVRADRITTERGVRWLHLTLWNCTTEPLRVPTSLAPWGKEPLVLTLHDAAELQGRSWERTSIPEQAPATEMVVEAGGHIEGKQPLTFQPFAKNAKEKGPFVLFWSYNTGWLHESPARQLSGTLNIGIGGSEARQTASPCASPDAGSSRQPR